MSGSRSPRSSRPTTAAPARRSRSVSRPHDPAETQADKAADIVARGGSVSGWSFGSVPLEAGVHREGTGQRSDEDKLKEGAKKAGEAALETEAGKRLQEKIKDTPLVKGAEKFLDTTAGKVVAGGVVAAGVGGLAAAKQPLPFQAPAIPLDQVTPGLSATVTVEGPVNAPTFVGLSLTYKEQGPKGASGPSEKERIASDIARLRAQQEMFKPQAQRDQEKADEQAAIARYLASQQRLFGTTTLVPLLPGAKPRSVDQPASTTTTEKKPEDAPVQREPATATEEPAASTADAASVDDAVRGPGRPLDHATRRLMESRFGYDFSGVRLHDDAQAATAAAGIDARAFTVGEDIVLGHGEGNPTTPEGRHLLAHEVAHVVQQRGIPRSSAEVDGERLQRRSIFESLGILLGLSEGTWSDQELRGYLDQVTATQHIDGAYDADNKARAIVRKWKRGEPGWDLLGAQKALLIDEMVDGPTLGDDEEAILDLLERSDAADLRVIFASAQERTLSLEANLDGDNRKRLGAFEAARFRGGRTELLAGRVVVVGDVVPADAPSFRFDVRTFDARLESDRTPQELEALIDRFAPDDRQKALDHLLHEVWPQARDDLGRLAVEYREAEGTAAEALVEKARVAKARRSTSEQLLEHYFQDAVTDSAASLTAATKPVDSARRQELRDVLKPKQYSPPPKPAEKETVPAPTAPEPSTKPAAKKAPTGSKPAAPEPPVGFHDDDKYRVDADKALREAIDARYDSHVTNAGKRATKEEIQPVAKVAKKVTDEVFGAYYVAADHPELTFAAKGKPGNLHFWYDTAQTELKAMDTSQRKETAKSWIRYYYQSDDGIRNVNDTYTADPRFDAAGNGTNREGRILAGIAEAVVKDPALVTKLLETRRNWGGMASGSDIYVDLFHDPDTEADRRAQWDLFQTLVHEYLHTLRSKPYTEYAKSFGYSSVEWNTLVEGIDCVLDEVVWARVLPRTRSDELRTVVEGKTNAKLPPIEPPYPARYRSYAEAFALVGKVGIQNVYAAYFLGLVDRISAPLPPAKKKAKKP